ncbi:uncharacterized protein LOC144141551 isoform X2 [Haemaphysalis longicornis]
MQNELCMILALRVSPAVASVRSARACLWTRRGRVCNYKANKTAVLCRLEPRGSNERTSKVEKCRTRWRTLRDSYVKRKRHPSSRTRGRWDLLEHKLRFLDDHLRPPRRSQVRRAAVKSKPEHETNPGGCTPVVPLPLLEAEYGADMELSLLPDVTPRSPIPLPPPSPVVQERSEDPVELFCLGLAPQLKRLMPRERMKAEMWVLQVLHGLEHGLVGADVDPQAAGSAPENLGA